MAEAHLVVSNPPHSDPDPAAVAPHLGCSAAEARIKLNFPAPEIWVVQSDTAAAGRVTKELVGMGARVAWVPGTVLASVPRPAVCTAVVIENEVIKFATNIEEIEVSSEHRVVAVLGEPVHQDVRPTSQSGSMTTQKIPARGPAKSVPRTTDTGASNAASELDDVAEGARASAESRMSDLKYAEPTELFLDVYVLGENGWNAARLAPSLTDFSGLGDRKQPTARANIGAIVELLKADFGARLDERLVKVAYKSSIVSGLTLNQVLTSISEQLASLTPYDIGSQLSFLTSKD